MTRHLASVCAVFFLVLAGIGILLPGVPTVPFLLLATWFSARGSPRLHQWIYAHPKLGPLLNDWEAHGAIARRSKALAIAMLVVSWLLLYPRLQGSWLLVAISVLFGCVATYLLTRPAPPPKLDDTPPTQ